VPIGPNDWEGLSLASGRYLITAKLGEGGMGFVYRAIDQNIESEVVIKIPRQAMMDDPEFAGRFTREIRSLVKLSHPHIVKVTDVGTWDSTPFAVMQYLAGGSLEDQRPTGPDGQVLPCDPRTISGWLIAVAQALDYIHVQGYVHRDVKPGNILFDALGHAFLSDFGVAKVLASSTNAPPTQTAMTGAGMVLGTPEYMAPELIMGETFGGRVDQYALAVTVYELLCGRRPFEDGTKTKILVLHTSKAPPALTAWCPTLPERLSQAVLKGLAKEPGRRYATCVELAKAVAAAAEGAVARDDRVRLTCAACGRTGSLTAADFAKLKAGGGRANCPGCKSPIDLSSTGLAAPGATPGGTMKFSFAGNTSEYPVASAPPVGGGTTAFTSPAGSPSGANKSNPARPPERATTVAMSASVGQAPQPAPVQSKPTPARGSGTLIERALPRVDQAPATVSLTGLTGTNPERSDALSPEKPVATRKIADDKTRILIAAGSGAAVVLLVVAVSVAIFSRSGKPSASGSAPSPQAASQTQIPAATKPDTASNSAVPPSTVASLPAPVESHTPPPPAEKPANRNAEPGKLATADDPVPTKKQQRRKNANSAADRPQPSPPTGIFAAQKFDASRLARRVTHIEYAAGKDNLARARARRGEIVIPGGMYSLTRAGSDNPAGARKYIVTECALEEKGPKKLLEMAAHRTSEVEVEPGLAKALDSVNSSFLRNSVAILTLIIDNSGECGLVRAELLEECIPRLKKGFGFGQADVDYKAMTVTHEGAKSSIARDEDWQKVGRMSLFFVHWKHRVDGMNRLRQTIDMAKLTNTMGSMYSDAMKGVAAAGAAERARQSAISRRP
jgi:hypothetical protein